MRLRVLRAETARCCSVLGLLSAIPAFAGGPDHWHQWGGDQQDFKVPSATLSATWDADGPGTRWQRPLGPGYSSVVVAEDGHLYTMYRDEEQQEEIVVAMSADDGETIWESRNPAVLSEKHVKQFGNGPNATPLIVGDRLYTTGINGLLQCFDRSTGKRHWAHDLWKEFADATYLNFGYSCSPIPHGRNVIVTVGGSGQAIVAFDQKSGEVAWKAQDYENSYCTPKVVSIDGRDVLICFMAEHVIGLDPRDGRSLFEHPFTNQWKTHASMPVLGPDNILFCSTARTGSCGLKLTPQGDRIDVEELWTTRKARFYHVPTICVGEYIYGSSGEQSPAFFAAINIRTGDVAWRERGLAKATCLYADGRFIALDEDGKLALIKADPERFELVSEVDLLDASAWAAPTLVNDTLYVRDNKTVRALRMN